MSAIFLPMRAVFLHFTSAIINCTHGPLTWSFCTFSVKRLLYWECFLRFFCRFSCPEQACFSMWSPPVCTYTDIFLSWLDSLGSIGVGDLCKEMTAYLHFCGYCYYWAWRTVEKNSKLIKTKYWDNLSLDSWYKKLTKVQKCEFVNKLMMACPQKLNMCHFLFRQTEK